MFKVPTMSKKKKKKKIILKKRIYSVLEQI